MPRVPPPPRKKGEPGHRGPKTRRLLVNADLGDGKRKKCWFLVNAKGVTVRVFHGKHRWHLPLAEAVAAIARRSQVRSAEMRLGTRKEADDPPARRAAAG
jgi:hypothetical protein